MYIEALPQGLIEVVTKKLDEDKKKDEKPEEIIVNPTIESPYSVRNQ